MPSDESPIILGEGYASELGAIAGLAKPPNGSSPKYLNIGTEDGLDPPSVVIIEKRHLIRGCLERCIGELFGCPTVSFSDMESWRQVAPNIHTLVIIVGWEKGNPEAILELNQVKPDAPVIVMSDAPGVAEIEKSFKCGARGYVSSNITIEVVVEAIRLVSAGGIFVPAEILLQASSVEDYAARAERVIFTAREKCVVDALRKGKANKAIAHELKLSESTVKLHVHNIMRKLQAKNRTEVAMKV